jgi:hypothetical protein
VIYATGCLDIEFKYRFVSTSPLEKIEAVHKGRKTPLYPILEPLDTFDIMRWENQAFARTLPPQDNIKQETRKHTAKPLQPPTVPPISGLLQGWSLNEGFIDVRMGKNLGGML